jgi:hypothetical protein
MEATVYLPPYRGENPIDVRLSRLKKFLARRLVEHTLAEFGLR